MTESAIRDAFAQFVPIAVRGLDRMVSPDGKWFCFLARPSQTGGLSLEDKSERYSAMSLIGLAQDVDGVAASRVDTAPIADSLHAWAPTAHDLGDASLVLWSEILREDARAEATAAAILVRRDEIHAPGFDLASMENGCLLLGLAEAMRAGIGGTPVAKFAADLADLLRGNQSAAGLFSFGRKLRRKNVHRARMDYRLGSFASQVYPIMGFAAYARAAGDDAARDVARRCAARICELQGDEGQWWWVFHSHRPETAVRYPVYTVHQDAMGPMALFAAALADGGTDRYDASVQQSFGWFDDRTERTADELVDRDLGVVWRAVQHDDPAQTGRLGLGRGELSRMGRATWLGFADRRELDGGFTCRECRPYHLGWILLAAGLFEQCLAQRTLAR